MTQEPKLLTEVEALAIWDEAQDRHPGTFVKALRERGLIAPEPVDPLLIEAREMLVDDHTRGSRSFGWGGTHHKYGAANELIREGKFDSDVGLNQYLRALRRGMELRPTLTREMVEAAYREAGKAVGGICTTQDYCDALHAALVERLP